VSVRSSIAVLAVLAVVGLLTYGLLSKGSSGLAIGDPAPDTTMPLLDGHGDGSLAEYRGRWVLVNVWASWCIPCKEEAPVLGTFQKQHGGADFTVLGIDSRDLTSDGRAFVRRYGLKYPQLRDGNGDVAHEFGTTGVPENFLITPRGKLRLHFVGPVTAEDLRESVAPLLSGGKS
jgi:cytochrome c biogenesis protein CcmG/thiol:disulfide interchange protein DsbE